MLYGYGASRAIAYYGSYKDAEGITFLDRRALFEAVVPVARSLSLSERRRWSFCQFFKLVFFKLVLLPA